MKKLGIITTSLLLTASLAFYSGRSHRTTANQNQLQPQNWVGQIIPFKEGGKRGLFTFVIKGHF